MSKSWLDDARRVPLEDVLHHLGIGAVSGRTVAPCPSRECGQERRGSGDRRGPVDLRDVDGTTLWHCKRCNRGGDGIAAVSHHLGGGGFKALDPDDKRRVQAWYSDRGWAEAPADHRPPARRPTPPPVRRVDPEQTRGSAARPPRDEVDALWQACRRVGEGAGHDATSLLYLQDRGYHPPDLRDLDVVRIAPEPGAYAWPAWWPGDRWADFKLVFRGYDASGEPVSLHARRTARYLDLLPVCDACQTPLPRQFTPRRKLTERCPACDWRPNPKTRWPAMGPGSAEGLLFADAGGAAILRGEPQHDRVLIVEGVTDLLRAALVAPRLPCAVIGFASGGARALGDVRWPPGITVALATDSDPTGEAYADSAAAAMAPIRPRRVRWEEVA